MPVKKNVAYTTSQNSPQNRWNTVNATSFWRHTSARGNFVRQNKSSLVSLCVVCTDVPCSTMVSKVHPTISAPMPFKVCISCISCLREGKVWCSHIRTHSLPPFSHIKVSAFSYKRNWCSRKAFYFINSYTANAHIKKKKKNRIWITIWVLCFPKPFPYQ